VPKGGFLVSKSNGNYVTLNSASLLVATATSQSSATYFNFATITGGYTIQAQPSNQFVSADNTGTSPLVANRPTASGWETFVFTAQSGGYWTITATDDNEYVAIQPSTSNELLANVAISGTIPATALFQIVVPSAPTSSINPTTSPQIKLYSKSAGAYVTVDAYSNLVATAGTSSLAVTWNVATISGGYSLQNAATSEYASADNNGGSPVIANRPSPSGWETFGFVAQSGGAYSILATDNGQLVAVQSNSQLQATVANSGTIPSSALFYIVSP